MKLLLAKKSNKRLAMSFKKGITLIEMTVTIALLSLLTVVMATFMAKSLKVYRISQQSVRLQERVTHVLGEFEYSTRAADKIVTANTDEIVFYRYYDMSSAAPTQVRYFIKDNQFKVGKTLPQGAGPNYTYPAGEETIDFLIEDVTNPNALFTYFDDNGNQLLPPTMIASIRMVGLGLTLDVDPAKPPTALTATTKVNLRNMKRNL